MPTVQYPDGTYHTDSTPILVELETAGSSHRATLPPDPGQAFLSSVIEDLADEWLSKCLFWLRFGTETAGRFAALWVMDDARAAGEGEDLEAEAEQFRARQIARMPLVGATAENSGVLDWSLAHTLAALESFAGNERFLFGSRPSIADFGLYGQLRTISIDPTGLARVRASAPRTEHWLRRLDDASGVEGQWERALAPPAVEALLELAGACYLPYLEANAKACEDGAARFEVETPAGLFGARPFPYHRKCLQSLRRAEADLPEPCRERTRAMLPQTGCERAFLAPT